MSDPVTIGEHRILCGDVLLGDVDRLMLGEKADVVYTDPPWGAGMQHWFASHANTSVVDGWTAFKFAFAAALHAHAVKGAPIFVEMGLRWADEIVTALAREDINISQRWTTQYGSPARPAALLYAGPLLEPGVDLSTLKDAALPRACLEAVGKRGGIVLDPCCGKGYTARAAMATGMRFRGLELNPKRLEVTEKHLRKGK